MERLTSGQTAGGALPPTHRLSCAAPSRGFGLLFYSPQVCGGCPNMSNWCGGIGTITDISDTREKRGLRITVHPYLRWKVNSPSPDPHARAPRLEEACCLLHRQPNISSLSFSLRFNLTFKVLFSANLVPSLHSPLLFCTSSFFSSFSLTWGGCSWDLGGGFSIPRENDRGGIARVEACGDGRLPPPR